MGQLFIAHVDLSLAGGLPQRDTLVLLELLALATGALALLDEALEASIIEILGRAGLVRLIAESALGVAIARRHQRLVSFGIDGLSLSLQ